MSPPHTADRNQRAIYSFRLYVADSAPNSRIAFANLAEFCRAYLIGRAEIERIDVLQHPERAHADGVTMAPTLVVVEPAAARITGPLDDPVELLRAIRNVDSADPA